MNVRSIERTLMPSQFRHRWEMIRSKGAFHFIIMRGLVRYGLTMFALLLLLTLYLHLGGHPFPHSLPAVLARGALICAFAGLLWGLLTWFSNEWLFTRRSRQRLVQVR